MSTATGWHRPVRRRHVVLVLGTVMLCWAASVAGAAWYVRTNWETAVAMRHQALTLRLPTGMPARAQVSTPLYTQLDVQSKLAVPIDQMVGVQLMNKLGAQAVITTTVPVDTTVAFDQDIPVSTEVEMKVPLVSWLPAMEVMVPVRFSVPVHMVVPVRLSLPLALDVHVAGELNTPLKVPIRTTLNLKVPVHARLKAEVLNRADFNLVGLQKPFDLAIDQAQVRVPLSGISWCRRQGADCAPSETTGLAGKSRLAAEQAAQVQQRRQAQ